MENTEQLDFVGLGDITTDAFIRLEDASVNCTIDEDACQLCMDFGSKIPYESVTVVPAVGNSPNASVSAHRLGLKSALITFLGDDKNGEEMLEQLKKEGVDDRFITIEKSAESNYHYVLLYDAERTILVKHHEYAYTLPEFTAPPRWIYLSSLGENSIPYHHEIAQYVKDNPEVNLAFQPGTFQIKLGSDTLKDIYEVSALFFCNKQEAQRILKSDAEDMKELLKGVHALGPKTVVITDGRAGAFGYDGKDVWQMPMYPDPAPPVDRTGAGDSFSSTVTAMLARGMTLPEALARGPINSMSVVQHIGAQAGLLPLEKLEQYLADAPSDYKVSKL